ncbi:MAG UNVERIFIED_CONTAM: hypothetical protein LVR29_05195 [Microcystis novacekii LVE1205-3]
MTRTLSTGTGAPPGTRGQSSPLAQQAESSDPACRWSMADRQDLKLERSWWWWLAWWWWWWRWW